PGINDTGPIAPSPGGTVYPLDHIITYIQGIGIVRKDLDLKGILVPYGLKGLVPPSGPIQKRGADWFRGTVVQIVSYGPDRLAHGGPGVFLLQAVPSDKLLQDRFMHRAGVVVIGKGKRATSGVEGPHVIIVVGKFDQGMVLGHGHQTGIRCHGSNPCTFGRSEEYTSELQSRENLV